MAWETRAKQKYYYRASRVGGKVKKVYCGGGAAGLAGAEADTTRRMKHQADALAWLVEKTRLEAITAFGRSYTEACELLADAALLCAGFHRAKRSPWRAWNGARDVLQLAGGAGNHR